MNEEKAAGTERVIRKQEESRVEYVEVPRHVMNEAAYYVSRWTKVAHAVGLDGYGAQRCYDKLEKALKP